MSAIDPNVQQTAAPAVGSAYRWLPPLSLTALLLACPPLLVGTWVIVGALAPEAFKAVAAAQLWRGFVGVQCVLWLSIVLGNWSLLRPRSPRFWFAAASILVVLALVQLVGVLPGGGALPKLSLLGEPLQRFVSRFVSIGIIAAALVSAAGIEATASLKAKPSFTELRATLAALRQTGLALAWVLVAAVFSTSWLQRALTEVERDSYPKEFVLSYGLFFSVIFVAIFGPCLTSYQKAATAYLDRALPFADSNEKPIDKNLIEERATLAGELGLTGTDSFQAVLAILSPLLGAITSISLGND